MKHRRTPATVGFVCGLCCAAALSQMRTVSFAQDNSIVTSQPSPSNIIEDEGKKLLSAVHDNVFSFDDPAFYWLCKKVRRDVSSDIYHIQKNNEPIAWKFLLERPSDYRGELVTVEGRLEARYTYDVANRPGVGLLYQCELSNASTRGICTVIVIEDPEKIPHAATVRAKGYFVKSRSYRSQGGDISAGPLLVVPRLEIVTSDTSSANPFSKGLASNQKWLWFGGLILFIGWIALRRGLSMSSRRIEVRSPRARSDEESPRDFDWLIKPDADKASHR